MSRALADFLVILHASFVLFVLFGGILILKWKWIAWIHLPAVLWGVWIELFGGICPLTPLENWLRKRAGGTRYASGFIDHYLVPLLYPAQLTREDQILLGVGLGAFNLIIYVAVIWKNRRFYSRL